MNVDELTLDDFLKLLPDCAPCAQVLGVHLVAQSALSSYEEFLEERKLIGKATESVTTETAKERDPIFLQDADIVIDTDRLDWFARCFQSERFRVVSSLPRARKDVAVVLWDSEHRFTRLDKDPFGRVLLGHSYGSCENWLTCKDALATMIDDTHGRVPWFPESYRICKESGESGSLRNNFLPFLGAFLRDRGAPWIIKPASEARSRGIVVSAELNVLLAAIYNILNSGGNVCVACRYVSRPVLLKQHKFDLRFVIAVRSSEPLELFVYDYFFVRRALKEYKLDFEDQLQHLTVVQYLFRDPRFAGPLEMPGDDFPRTEDAIRWLEENRPDLNVETIIADCHNLILELFHTACGGYLGEAGERMGIIPHDKVRAVYGIDILLEERGNGVVQPLLLECNYKPDNRRLLEQRPQFLDHTFNLHFPPDASGRYWRELEGAETSRQPSSTGGFIRLQ